MSRLIRIKADEDDLNDENYCDCNGGILLIDDAVVAAAVVDDDYDDD